MLGGGGGRMYQVDEIAGGEPGGGSRKGQCVISRVNKGTSRNRGHWGDGWGPTRA